MITEPTGGAPAQRAIIVGAAGRDFHNFNVHFRANPAYEVVAFTAAQIPDIAGRRYPTELAGARYADGIPIEPESELERLIATHRVDVVVFAYSDVTHEHVMHIGSRAIAAGADYLLLGPRHTMLEARVPVVAICAARTGSGKSQTSRHVARLLTKLGRRPVVVRHPMPYGDLAAQAVQRFATVDDLDRFHTTIEEREDYEPHLVEGRIVYAGVDYERILRACEREGDVIVWDGGNNDFSFFRPDVSIAVLDPHRAEHASTYHPGETVVRMADVLVINKIDTAGFEQVEAVRRVARRLNARAELVEAASPIRVDEPDRIRGRRVLVVEDGPTLTHGGMPFGAGWVAAQRFGAAEIVDPRPFAVGSIRETFGRYPDTGPVLPAMGYGAEQVDDLAETIKRAPVDLVLVATPIDLGRVVSMAVPSIRVRYDLQVVGEPTLEQILGRALSQSPPAE